MSLKSDVHTSHLVSIVVPIHNCSKTIDACVESLVGQTYGQIEILLVENGSSDNTYELARRWRETDDRIALVQIPEADVTAARAEGVRLARGGWLMFCDSDDWYERDAVEKLITSALFEGADIVDAGYSKRVSPRLPRVKLMIPEISDDGSSAGGSCLGWCNPIRFHQFSGLWGSIYRRDLFDEVPDGILNSGLRRGEDILVNACLHMVSKKHLVIPEALYNYRIGGVTSGNYRLLDDLIARGDLLKEFIAPLSDDDVRDVEYENACYVLKVIELRYKSAWAVSKSGQIEFYKQVLNDRRIRQLSEIVRAAAIDGSPGGRYAQLILDGDLDGLMAYERSTYGLARIGMVAVGNISKLMRARLR